MDSPLLIEAADMDGDVDLDVVTASPGSKTIAVIMNLGGQVFAAPRVVDAGIPASLLALADLDADGYRDVAVGEPGMLAVRVFSNDGSGVLGPAVVHAFGDSPLSGALSDLVAADMNGDERSDLVLVAASSGAAAALRRCSVLLQRRGGGLEKARTFALRPMTRVAAVDLDGNSFSDLVSVQNTTRDVSLHLNLSGPPVAPDCNDNGIPDACELESGSLDTNSDGVPDECEPSPRFLFRRGDTNGDGHVDAADVLASIDALFPGFVLIPPGRNGRLCSDAADANDDGVRGLSDVVYLASFVFSGGPPPAAPFTECGADPTADALECAGVPGC